jgi:hypothetical protein
MGILHILDELPASPRQRDEVIGAIAECAEVEDEGPLCFCYCCAGSSIRKMREEQDDESGNRV